MNKTDVFNQIIDYKAKSAELNRAFMAEDDIVKAKELLEESKGLARTIADLEETYRRLEAREKQDQRNKIKDIFDKSLGRR